MADRISKKQLDKLKRLKNKVSAGLIPNSPASARAGALAHTYTAAFLGGTLGSLLGAAFTVGVGPEPDAGTCICGWKLPLSVLPHRNTVGAGQSETTVLSGAVVTLQCPQCREGHSFYSEQEAARAPANVREQLTRTRHDVALCDCLDCENRRAAERTHLPEPGEKGD